MIKHTSASFNVYLQVPATCIKCTNIYIYIYIYTELIICPFGISELDCATTKTDTAERSISIDRESLQVFFFFGTRGLGVLAGSTARG